MNKLRVYQYDGCSTCKKAMKFLERKGIAFESIPIVEQPPTEAELKKMLQSVGDLKRLFNTSGQLYREMGMSEKLKSLTVAQALKLLSQHGKLVKRPFALGPKASLVGFSEPEWSRALK